MRCSIKSFYPYILEKARFSSVWCTVKMIFPTSQMPSQSKFSQINHITRTNQIMLSNTIYLTTTVEELSQLSLEFKIYFESRKIMSLLAKRGNPSAFRRSEVIWLSKFKLDEIGLLPGIQNEKFSYYFNKIRLISL